MGMGDGVAKVVGVNAAKAGLLGPAVDHLS
jgi:hypothetical protein